MNDPRHDISAFQLMSFIISAQIGVGSLFLPGILAQKVGHDGWITTMLSGVICIILTLIIMLLLKRYNDKSIFDIYFVLYGKIIGYIFNILFVGYLIVVTASVIRGFQETINIITLKFTPPIVLTFFVIIPTIYATMKGLKVICRFSMLMYISYFLIIFSYYLNWHNTRMTYIMPVGKAGLGTILQNLQIPIYSYLGFELSALLYPNVNNKPKALKFMIFSMIFTTIFYTILVAYSIILFGEIKLSMLVFPIYSMEQMIPVPVIERMDTIFLIFWFPTMDSTLRAYFFSTYYSISTLFKIKRNKVLLLFVTIMLVILSRIPPSFESLTRYSFYVAVYGMSIISIIIFTFFISLFIKKGVKTN